MAMAESPDAKTTQEVRPVPPKMVARSDDPPVTVSNVSGPGYNPDAARPETLAEGFEPDADVVQIVSRDVNGDPSQSRNYAVLVPDGASMAVRAAHHNRPGEVTGAKFADGGDGQEIDPAERHRLLAGDAEDVTAGHAPAGRGIPSASQDRALTERGRDEPAGERV